MGVLPGKRTVISEGFGPWLVRVRKGRGMTLTQLAEKMSVDQGTVRLLEKGTRRERALEVELFVRLSNALGLDLGYVLHKAGYDVGSSGVNLARLGRVERIMEALASGEPKIRLGLAEAMAVTEGQWPDIDKVRADIGLALAAFDLITERLREEDAR